MMVEDIVEKIMEEIVDPILRSIFGKKERESVVRGGGIKIGDGIIQLWEQTMPLDAVSMLDVTQLAPIPYIKPIVFLIISVLLLFLLQKGKGIFIVTGMMAVAVIVFFYILNQRRPYFLDIYNHMGYRMRLEHWNKSFLIELKEKIEECIKNKGINLSIDLSKGKVDMSGSKIEGDVMGGSARKYQAGGDIITDNGRKEKSGNINTGYQISENGSIVTENGSPFSVSQNGHSDTSISFQDGISDEEWELIRKFAESRQKDYPKDNIYHKICNNMQFYAVKKDAGGFKNLVKKVGKNAMASILSVCTTEAVKNIVDMIFRVG